MAKPKFDPKRWEDLGAAVIAYEIAIVAILETLAKTQPATARSVAQALAAHRQAVPQDQFPKVPEKVKLYEDMIATILAQKPQ